MNFFIKLVKVLNSAQKPWQITLAVVLGMLMGLTPLSGIQTYLILLIAFIVNIHLGFFFIMAAQFAGIGYLFDPLFDDLGFYLLSLDSLQGIWTSMYNSGLMRLTYFNNTIVLGSTLTALLLALPLYFVISRLLDVYRLRVANFCKQNKWLNKFGFFNKPDKPEKAFRLWGLGVFVTLSVLIILVVILFLDSWIKIGLEKGLSTVFDKKVHIQRVNLSFSEASLKIDTLSLSGTRANEAVAVIGNIHADVNFNTLLLGKTHIEKISLTDIKFNQKTELFKNLAIEEANEKKANSAQDEKDKSSQIKEPSSETAFSLPSVDEVLKNSELGSEKAYEIAKLEIDSISNKWKKYEHKLAEDSTLKEIGEEFNSLKIMTKNLKIKNLKKFKHQLNTFKAKVNKQKLYYSQLKSEFSRDTKRIKKLINNVDQANKKDKQTLKSKYTLSGQGGVNLLGTFLGPKIKGYLQTAFDTYEKISPYLISDETQTTVIDRHKGRMISFKEDTPQTNLLISRVDISGTFEGQTFQANIKNISDNQKLLNKAITFSLLSDGPKATKLKLIGYDDRRAKVIKDYLKLSVQNIPNIALNLGMVVLHKSNMSLRSEVTLLNEESIKGYSQLKFKKSHLSAGNLSGSIGNSINSDLSKIKKFYANIDLKGSLSQPNITVKSDLSNYLKGSLDRYVKKQVAAFESELSRKLNARTQGKLSKLKVQNKNLEKQGSQLSKDGNKLKHLEKSSLELKASPSKSLKKIFNF